MMTNDSWKDADLSTCENTSLQPSRPEERHASYNDRFLAWRRGFDWSCDDLSWSVAEAAEFYGYDESSPEYKQFDDGIEFGLDYWPSLQEDA